MEKEGAGTGSTESGVPPTLSQSNASQTPKYMTSINQNILQGNTTMNYKGQGVSPIIQHIKITTMKVVEEKVTLRNYSDSDTAKLKTELYIKFMLLRVQQFSQRIYPVMGQRANIFSSANHPVSVANT